MGTNSDRIAVLRKRCLDRKLQNWPDVGFWRAQAYKGSEDISSWQERQGLCTKTVLSNTAFEIDDLEMLAGRLALKHAPASPQEISAAKKYLEKYPCPGGQRGHCEIYRTELMDLGVDGLMDKIRSRLDKTSGERASAYRSFIYALEGFQKMMQNSLECVQKAVKSSPAARRKELEVIADSISHVIHLPPKTFRQAIQLLWFADFAVQYAEWAWLVSPGHLDRSLARFYKADVAARRIKKDEALLLIEGLYLLVNELIPDGLAVAVMVGGRDEKGNDVTNDLSYLCLEALRRTKLVYPTVGVCWHKGTPDELVDLAIDLITKGYSTPAFFSDETIQKGMRKYGVPEGESCLYMNSTCVEITPVGSSNVWVASPYYNTCGLLIEEIDRCAETPPADFDSFKAGYFKRLAAKVTAEAEEQNKLRRDRRQYGRNPLQSVFTRDCIEKGRDIDDGGARYNWIECSFVGLANLADSLFVIQEEVFKQKKLDLRQLKEILGSDFKGHEAVRQRFLNAYPKYGQDNAAVDGFVSEAVEAVTKTCGKFKMDPGNSHYIPGAFVWVMHEALGRETGATPDGRKAGTPFADGAGPAQGRENKGPTAAILSTTRWDHSPFIGGVAFNMKFNTSLFTKPEGVKGLKQLVLSFLNRGGFETQINVIDRETLIAAQKDPDQYRDIVVRIGGYTDYFTRLSPAMQEEVLLRTEYDCV